MNVMSKLDIRSKGMDKLSFKKLLNRFENKLSSIPLYEHKKEFCSIRTVEKNLYGKLNPTAFMDDIFFNQCKCLTYDEFAKEYITKLHSSLDLHRLQEYDGMEWDDFEKGLKARLWRTYAGIMTEYHAYLKCKLIFGVDKVIRDINLDRLGVDFSINDGNDGNDGNDYHIHIFCDTDRAWYYRAKKIKTRAGNSLKGIHVNFPYGIYKKSKVNCNEVLPNGFIIYSDDYVKLLKREIENGGIKNDNICGIEEDSFKYKS